MKVFSVVMALVIAIFISGTASAATWEVVDQYGDDTTISVDKDSIRRGTDSKKFPKFNRKDGFSAIVKVDIKLKDGDNMSAISLVSFYEQNGKRLYSFLDSYDGTDYPAKESDIDRSEIDLKGSLLGKKVWDYIQSNLK